MEREPKTRPTPRAFTRCAAAACAAAVVILGGCAAPRAAQPPAQVEGVPGRGASAALTFDGPFVVAQGPIGGASWLASRNDAGLGAAGVESVAAERDGERQRPREQRIRIIYSQWGRSF